MLDVLITLEKKEKPLCCAEGISPNSNQPATIQHLKVRKKKIKNKNLYDNSHKESSSSYSIPEELIELKPPEPSDPINAKEIAIRRGELVKKKTDYPTMEDIVIDWDDPAIKIGNKKKVEEKEKVLERIASKKKTSVKILNQLEKNDKEKSKKSSKKQSKKEKIPVKQKKEKKKSNSIEKTQEAEI